MASTKLHPCALCQHQIVTEPIMLLDLTIFANCGLWVCSFFCAVHCGIGQCRFQISMMLIVSSYTMLFLSDFPFSSVKVCTIWDTFPFWVQSYFLPFQTFIFNTHPHKSHIALSQIHCVLAFLPRERKTHEMQLSGSQWKSSCDTLLCTWTLCMQTKRLESCSYLGISEEARTIWSMFSGSWTRIYIKCVHFHSHHHLYCKWL